MSKPSDTDKRYDRYADIFENPVDAEVLERGNRVLHSEFMENFQQSTGRLSVVHSAEEAVRQARRRDPEAARRADEAPRQRRSRSRGRSR